MTIKKIGIAMNGVTGRMGKNQHLIRSIAAIIKQGGVRISDDLTLMPDPILIGRSATRLDELSKQVGGLPYSTDLDAVLADPKIEIYFDATLTGQRPVGVMKAIAAGKHVYCEKPSAPTTQEALDLALACDAAGVKHGVVQDKLWLPGIAKLKHLVDTGFFGKILSVRGEFGYWVFTGGDPLEGGDGQVLQRPSWNYRKEDDGGIIVDMLCHWRYVLDNVFGEVKAVSCLGATHLAKRWDEAGKSYVCTADDAAYATFELEGDIVAQFNSSWCVRVRRDDLLTIQVDGTEGSAVAGLRECRVQHRGVTPRPIWNPDIPSSLDYFDGWQVVPDNRPYDNAFKAQWELFLRHVALDEPFPWTLFAGAKGVQLAELGLKSWEERRWLDVPQLGGAK
jgi:predicted dehydrogenase